MFIVKDLFLPLLLAGPEKKTIMEKCDRPLKNNRKNVIFTPNFNGKM